MPQSRPTQHFDGSGNLIGTTPRTVQDDQLRAEAAIDRLVTGRNQLRAIRVQSREFVINNPGTLTPAQLSAVARQIATAIADLAQAIMDIELVGAYQEDDGQS